jgi:hypothetical protein
LLDARFPLSVPFGSPKAQTVDTKVLDSYVGHYELAPTFILHVTREGDQLFVQATNQPRFAVYSKSEVEFFYKVVDAQITFEPDGQNNATALVLHQNGRDQTGKRIDAAQAKELEDDLTRRFKEQKADPRSEAAVRRQIDGLQRRQPNFDEFTPSLAEIARPQMPHIFEQIASLGALQSVTFKGVGPGGSDIYTLRFEHGSLDWRISLNAEGKIAGQFFHPLP